MGLGQENIRECESGLRAALLDYISTPGHLGNIASLGFRTHFAWRGVWASVPLVQKEVEISWRSHSACILLGLHHLGFLNR